MFGGLHLTSEQRKKILKETNDKDTLKDLFEFTDLICEFEKIMNKDKNYFTKQITKEKLINIINDKIDTIKSFPEIEENEIDQEEFYKIYLKVCEIENILKDIMKIKYNIK